MRSFRRRSRFKDGHAPATGPQDVEWSLKDGTEIKEQQWKDSSLQSLGIFLNGRLIDLKDARGRPVVDDSFIVIMKAAPEGETFILPAEFRDFKWDVIMDTAKDRQEERKTRLSGQEVPVQGRSLVLLQHRTEDTQKDDRS